MNFIGSILCFPVELQSGPSYGQNGKNGLIKAVVTQNIDNLHQKPVITGSGCTW